MITMFRRRSAAACARLVTTGGSIAAISLVLAACGGSSTSGSSTSASAAKGPSVGAIRVGGLSVLADAGRLPLYSPAQEASGHILCTGACAKVWKPVAAGGLAQTTQVAGKLGVVMRPDGIRQLTDGARPLYTFAGDSPGQLKGNGLADQFNGHRFTWHAILGSGAVASSSASSTSAPSASGTQAYRSPY